MVMKTRYLLTALAGGALWLSGAAQARLIDDFNTGDQALVVCKVATCALGTNPNPTDRNWDSSQAPQAASANIVGGYRDLWLASDEPTTATTGINRVARLIVEVGSISLSNDVEVDSSAIFKWDGDNGAYTGTNHGVDPNPTAGTVGSFSSAVDLTDGGVNQSFRFLVDRQDGDFNFRLTVYEEGGSVSYTGNSGQAFATPQPFVIPMVGVNGFPGATLDNFDAVKAITLEIDSPTTDRDFAIDQLDTGCSGIIGDFVWLDANEDGIQNDGPTSGIGGVTLNLYSAVGHVLLRTTATDSDGFYRFTALCRGDYVVEVDASTLPAGVVPTLSNQGGDPTQDSNGSPASVSLADDFFAEDLTIDFGYIRPAVCNSTITIEKYTNGVDADTPQEAPVVAVGSEVTWTYDVTTASTPSVPLHNIVVTDDAGTPGDLGDDFSPAPVLSGGFNVGDTDQDNLLDPGETWQYQETGTAMLGLYGNVATVTGDPEDARCEQVRDDDPSHYTGEALGTQGCTPGYWKQDQHFWAWTAPYTPATLFSAVFEDAFPGKTLLQVLGLGGGGLNALGRHTVAALLNAAAANVAYPYTALQVIDAFNAVFPGGDYEGLKDDFDAANNLGCPLGNGP
jgi:hypothetical protein